MRSAARSLSVLAAAASVVGLAVAVPASASARSAAVAPAAASSSFVASDLNPSGTVVPDTNYAIPSDAIYMATTGSDANAGTLSAPVLTLNAAYALVPSGGTIVARAGVYRDWLHNTAATSYKTATKPFTLQAYPHSQVWFDGTDVEAGSKWTSDGNGHWYMNWSTPQFCDGGYRQYNPQQPAKDANGNLLSGPCRYSDAFNDPNNPASGDPQLAFINNVNQHQVTTLAQATSGNFYYDWNAQRIYVSANPSTSTVQLSARPIALSIGANNVTIRGIGFRRYASDSFPNNTTGAVVGNSPWTGMAIESDVFTQMAAQGLTIAPQTGSVVHSVIVNNGYTGIGSNGDQHGSKVTDGLQIQANVISGNNTEHFDYKCTLSCAAAGIKVAHMDGFTMSGNIVENNVGSAGGMWCDLACTNGVMVDNLIEDNGGTGLTYEVSDTGILASNLIVDNGAGSGAGVGIFMDSADTAVYNNTVVGNVQGIVIADDARTYGVGGWTDVGPDTKNVRMANNVVVGDNYSLQAYPVSNSSVAPNTGADQFFSTLDYDSFYQTDSSLALVVWRQLGGSTATYKSMSTFYTGEGWEQHGYSLLGTDTTDPEGDPFFVDAAHGNYNVRPSSTAYKSGVALPSDVATALGVAAGTVPSRGAISWPGVQANTAGALVTVPATSVLDTRTGLGGTTGPVASKTSVPLQVDGRGGVPQRNVSAVVLDVSVLAPTTGGFVTAYPGGTTLPVTSNLSFDTGQSVSNRVIVQVSSAGLADLYLYAAGGGTAQLTASVSGYFVGGTANTPGAYVPTTSSRLLDTRSGVGAPLAPVTNGQVLAVQLGGRGGIPASGVSAVVMNLVAVAPTGSGYLSAYADGASRTTASVVPVAAGQSTTNLAVVPVSTAGKIDIYNADSPSGTMDLVGDVFGYVRSGTVTTPGNEVATNPVRFLDTRSNIGATGPVAANGVVHLVVAGRGAVPATGAAAVVLNVTVAASSAAGTVTVWADGAAKPAVPDVSFAAGQIVSMQVIAPVGADGNVDLSNDSTGTTQLVADVAGYYVPGQR